MLTEKNIPAHKKPLIPKSVSDLIQLQIKKEFDSSQIYYAMSVWCDDKGFVNSTNLFKQYADEERVHAQMLITYLLDRNIKALVPAIDTPNNNFKDLRECYYNGYTHELMVEDSIKGIIVECIKTGDITTRSFLEHEFILEQIEEAAKFKLALDMFDTLTSVDNRDYLFDLHNVAKLT